jgi:hypothetical protein
LPAWVAWIVQVPTVTMVTLDAENVQTVTVKDVRVTARPDDAVALIVNGVGL